MAAVLPAQPDPMMTTLRMSNGRTSGYHAREGRPGRGCLAGLWAGGPACPTCPPTHLPVAVVRDPLAELVEVRPSKSALRHDRDLVPVRGRLEVAGIAQVLLDHLFVQFDSQPRRVRHGDVSVLDERLRNAGHQLLPPGHEIHGVAFHRQETFEGAGDMHAAHGP